MNIRRIKGILWQELFVLRRSYEVIADIIVFPFTNMVIWGMGVPLGVTAWAGWALGAWQVIRSMTLRPDGTFPRHRSGPSLWVRLTPA